MREKEAKEVVHFIDRVLKNIDHHDVIQEVRKDVRDLCKRFPVYIGRPE
jgi:glycine/serine hydroxymethyltransferase